MFVDSYNDGCTAGGVYDGTCSTNTDHAIAVVGYGTDAASGDKYWLIKNSWGSGWGDGGYMKLKRGVGKCGIGGVIATVTCGRSSDPTRSENIWTLGRYFSNTTARP